MQSENAIHYAMWPPYHSFLCQNNWRKGLCKTENVCRASWGKADLAKKCFRSFHGTSVAGRVSARWQWARKSVRRGRNFDAGWLGQQLGEADLLGYLVGLLNAVLKVIEVLKATHKQCLSFLVNGFNSGVNMKCVMPHLYLFQIFRRWGSFPSHMKERLLYL